MRGSRIVRRSAMLVAGLATWVVLGGCPRHENFPTQIALIEAPAPSDFVITAQPFTNGTYDYDLTWTISDPTHVDRYRLYLVGTGLAPELLTETTGNSLPISLPFNAEGLQFGLSTVSTGSVESAMVYAVIPAIPEP